jgi:predicted phosphodiesterase
MKYAIIADIHANLPALQTVLRDAEQQGCTHTACLGDLVGYNWQPKECVDIIRGMNIPCVQGNHDLYCSTDEPLDDFKPQAAEAVQWTREQLTVNDRKWLRNLPLVQFIDGFTIVHALLDQPERWGYVFDKLMAATSLQHQTTPVCFFGHTHVPVAFVKDSVVRGGTFSQFKIEAGKQYFINAGSVGQPRDNNPKAGHVTYDLDTQVIELRRLDYPRSEPPPGGFGLFPAPKPPVGPRGPLRAEADEEIT